MKSSRFSLHVLDLLLCGRKCEFICCLNSCCIGFTLGNDSRVTLTLNKSLGVPYSSFILLLRDTVICLELFHPRMILVVGEGEEGGAEREEEVMAGVQWIGDAPLGSG